MCRGIIKKQFLWAEGILFSTVEEFSYLPQGTARRKKKVVHKTATDDKKLQVNTSDGLCVVCVKLLHLSCSVTEFAQEAGRQQYTGH